MSKPEQHKIDRIIERGVHRYSEIPFNEEAWERMEELLDKDKKRPFAWWWWLGLSVLLVGGFFFIKKYGQSSPQTHNIHLNHSQNEQSLEAEKANTKHADRNTEQVMHEDTAEPTTEKKTGISKPEPADNTESTKKTQDVVPQHQNFRTSSTGSAKGETAREQTPMDYTPLSQNPDAVRPIPKEQAILKTNSSPDILGHADYTNNAWETALDNKEDLIALAYLLPPIPGSLVFSADAPELDSQTVRPIIRPLCYKGKKLQFGLLTAIEANAVGYSGYNRVGVKIGFDAQYELGQKWKIGAGLMYNWKPYVAFGQEFKLPFPWPKDIVAEETHGICDMLEAPIFARYHPKGVNQSGWFYGASSSSYLLFKQYYYYIYPDNSPTDLVYHWEAKTPKYYWLGVLEGSMGYQFVGLKRPTVQVMPYFQVPLGPIGWGKTPLYSIGISLRTHP